MLLFWKTPPHLQEANIIGCDLVLQGDDGVRKRQDVSGDALRLLPHPLFLLLILLLQSGEPRLLFTLEEVSKLLELLADLFLCGLSLVLTHMMEIMVNITFSSTNIY